MSRKAKKGGITEESSWNWRWHKTCVIGSSHEYARSKIASFDMDSTLIETKSGATFAKDA